MLLQLASADIALNSLPWLEPPPAEPVEYAKGLLRRLGALESTRRITSLGRAMADIAVHPRLARFVIAAAEMGARTEAVEIAAKLSAGRFRLDSDAAVRFTSDLERIAASDFDYSTRRLRDQILRSTAAQVRAHDEHALEKAFLLAYPDRVARRRGETLLLSDGGSARLYPDSLTRSEFLVAIEAEERSDRGQPLVRLTSPIQPDWLLEYFPDRIESHDELQWNREGERVEQVSALLYDKLVIDETRSTPMDLNAASDLLVARVLEAGVERFADAEELQRFLRRMRFASRHAPDLKIPQDITAAALRQLATGLTTFRELREATRDGGLLAAMEGNLPMRLINQLAPTHVVLPNGRRASIEYHDTQPPSVSSRLQDFFGMTHSPSVALGAVPLVVQLLAPNHRPVQVTTDLPSFWKNLYPQLRRELGRRYPKHAWPEDPMLFVRSK